MRTELGRGDEMVCVSKYHCWSAGVLGYSLDMRLLGKAGGSSRILMLFYLFFLASAFFITIFSF
jgi:hypothetical protein